MKRLFLTLILGLALIAAPAVYADVATFENLTLASESYWNGSDGSGGFTSGDAYFLNTYNSAWGSWDGWAYSNMTDTTTDGVANQYSAITGGGVNGSDNYGVAYEGFASPPNVSFISDDYDTTICGAYITNTTYAYLSMRDGDFFAKKFGGDDGTDEDWFKLTIQGIDTDANYTGTVEFFLADYRFADSDDDYIVDEWTWINLTSLGNVVGLEFSLSSSDNGLYGMNTPAYFAMDNLNAVPIPGAFWLLGSGIIALFGIRRKKSL